MMNFKGKPEKINLDFKSVADTFHLKQDDASQELNCSTTTLKKWCRNNGIMRWPYRKILAARNKISKINERIRETKEKSQKKKLIREKNCFEREIKTLKSSDSYRAMIPTQSFPLSRGRGFTGRDEDDLDYEEMEYEDMQDEEIQKDDTSKNAPKKSKKDIFEEEYRMKGRTENLRMGRLTRPRIDTRTMAIAKEMSFKPIDKRAFKSIRRNNNPVKLPPFGELMWQIDNMQEYNRINPFFNRSSYNTNNKRFLGGNISRNVQPMNNQIQRPKFFGQVNSLPMMPPRFRGPNYMNTNNSFTFNNNMGSNKFFQMGVKRNNVKEDEDVDMYDDDGMDIDG